LAGVPSSLWISSAEHGVEDSLTWIVHSAGFVRDGWEKDPLEDVSKLTSLLGGAPSRHDDVSRVGLEHGCREGDGSNVHGLREGSCQVEEGDVVEKIKVIVLLVNDDLTNGSALFVGSLNSTPVLSTDNFNVRWSISNHAMSCSHDERVPNDGSSTNVRSSPDKGDLVGELTLGGGFTTDDLSTSGHLPLNPRKGCRDLRIIVRLEHLRTASCLKPLGLTHSTGDKESENCELQHCDFQFGICYHTKVG